MPAEKGNNYAEGNKGGGRKSLYKPEYADLVYKYCLLGATDKELASFFEVTEATINNWKDDHEEFFLALKRGKIQADAKIAQSLYHRAKGYKAPDIISASFQGTIITEDVIKHYPPDTTAAIFWLKNRQPAKWRDKQEHGFTDKEGNDVEPTQIVFTKS